MAWVAGAMRLRPTLLKKLTAAAPVHILKANDVILAEFP